MSTILEMTEKKLSAQVAELATLLGWGKYHTFRSTKSPAGWPDWSLWRDRVVFLELKTAKGKLSADQRRVLQGLVDAEAEVYVIRPDDVQLLASVLGARRNPYLIGSLTTASGVRARAALNAALSAELG